MPRSAQIKHRRATGGWRLDPPWRLVLPMAAFLPLLLWLGFWQLERAAWKTELVAAHAARSAAGPVAPRQLLREQQPNFIQLAATGSWLGERQLLLDNRTHNGRAGYEVLTPFRSSDGVVLLVNRGWLPAPPRRDQLPALPVASGEQTISGQAHVLAGTAPMYGAEEPDGGWPRRVQRFEPGQVARLLGPALAGATLFPHQVLLAPGHADALVRNWQPSMMQPDSHRGYAVQWFALALALVVLLCRVSLRRRQEPGEPRP